METMIYNDIPFPGEAAGTVVLAAQGVSFYYGSNRPAVEAVTASFKAGELTMIVGPNGSGKSTLLQLLLGHLVPAAGKITAGSTDITHLRPLARAALISYVPQNPEVSFAYRVHELVAMGAWARQRYLSSSSTTSTRASIDAHVITQVMWDLDIHALADRTYDELSTGERQRVALARAMVQDTPVILLDEPSAALDIWHQLELMERVKYLARHKHKTVLWVTHDLNSAFANADEVLILNEAKVVAHGKPRDVLVPSILEPVYRVKVEVCNNTLLFSLRPRQG
ncbi:MAG: ABC transporter ATP-binding protein [Planctomycetes bacterium]|nr:ABC transporter ATP-binding protein [Planctomycetota bacterium]